MFKLNTSANRQTIEISKFYKIYKIQAIRIVDKTNYSITGKRVIINL